MHGPQKAYFVSEEKDKTTINSLIKWGLFFSKLPDNIHSSADRRCYHSADIPTRDVFQTHTGLTSALCHKVNKL